MYNSIKKEKLFLSSHNEFDICISKYTRTIASRKSGMKISIEGKLVLIFRAALLKNLK